MVFTEIKGNLFEYNKDRIPVHCISQDCKMGAGIAKDMKKKYHLSDLVSESYPDCIYHKGVMNLVTKKYYYNKPTYESLGASLTKMKSICESEGISRLVMPRIGCGLDRLIWAKVRNIIEDTFKDSDIDILVCTL